MSEEEEERAAAPQAASHETPTYSFCPGCGTQAASEASFCVACGRSLSVETITTSAAESALGDVPPTSDGAVKTSVDLDEGGPGARILTRLLVILGVLMTIAGLAVWIDGTSNHETCTSVNQFTKGPVPPSNCSQTPGHVGFIIFLAGLGVLVLACLVRIARNRVL